MGGRAVGRLVGEPVEPFHVTDISEVWYNYYDLQGQRYWKLHIPLSFLLPHLVHKRDRTWDPAHED